MGRASTARLCDFVIAEGEPQTMTGTYSKFNVLIESRKVLKASRPRLAGKACYTRSLIRL